MLDSLGSVGWVDHPKVQDAASSEAGNVDLIVDGHMRVALAIREGESPIPVDYVDLSDEEVAVVLATYDPIGALAEKDAARYEALVAGIAAEGDGLIDLIEQLRETDRRNAPIPGLSDPDELAAAAGPHAGTPPVRPGDLWIMEGEGGVHRLLCGDATSEADVLRLLAGRRPELTVTDPPYGDSYDPKWRDGIVGAFGQGARSPGVLNDDLVDWRAAWLLCPGDVLYCWHAGRHASAAQQAIEAAGYEIRSQIVWAKQHFAISRGHYHWLHEPAWYAVRRGATAGWIGDRTQTTVWEIASLNPAGRQEERVSHGTQKPIECMERPIRNHEGDVYDPFVGSGTTIIAAERQRRDSFTCDLDPRCVGMALARWCRYTGRDAWREGDGASYRHLAGLDSGALRV